MTHIDTLVRYFAAHNKLFLPAIEATRSTERELFEDLGEKLTGWAAALLHDEVCPALSRGYASFVMDVNRSQMRYERDRHYLNKSYEEVYKAVYNDSGYMSHYHWGVYAATFLWPHHLQLYRYFRDQFLPLIRGATVLDLGCGSGVWGLLALDQRAAAAVHGVDMSQTSIDWARGLSAKVGLAEKTTHVVGDGLTFRGEARYGAGISCFLLEHLEQPGLLLENLAHNLEVGGYAFITCALTAAEIDHIFEFRRESEVVGLAEKSGFRVLSIESRGPTGYPRQYEFLPRSMALILQKRKNEIW